MLRELEAEVDPNAVRALDALAEQTVGRMYSGFEIDEPGLERLRQAAKDGTLVLLPSHKSHVDYIIIAISIVAVIMAGQANEQVFEIERTL